MKLKEVDDVLGGDGVRKHADKTQGESSHSAIEVKESNFLPFSFVRQV